MSELKGPQKLGPLTPLVGEWEGNNGLDVSYRHQSDEVTRTSYFERSIFQPIPAQQNGDQILHGLKYTMTDWRHGEEGMDPFHDEVGFLLWDEKNGQVLRVVVFGRGIAILAGATAGPRDRELHFKALPGDPSYGILQNQYLMERAQTKHFESTFKFNEDGSFSHSSNLLLDLKEIGEMDHTDEITLTRVKRYHPGAQYN